MHMLLVLIASKKASVLTKPPNKRARLKIMFLISHSKHMGAQKKHLNERFLLSTQNMFKLMDNLFV